MVARRGDARRTLRHARQGWTRHGSMSLSPRARGTTRGTDRRGSGYRRRRRRRRRRFCASTGSSDARRPSSPSPPSATPHSLFSRTTPTSRTTPERERWWNAPSERCTRTRAGARRWIRDRVAEKSDDDASFPRVRVHPSRRHSFRRSSTARRFSGASSAARWRSRGENDRRVRLPDDRRVRRVRGRATRRRRRCVARRRRSTPRRRLFWFRAPRRRFVWRRRSTRCSRRRV